MTNTCVKFLILPPCMSLLTWFQLAHGTLSVPANTNEGPPISCGRALTHSPRPSHPRSSPHSWTYSRSHSPPLSWGSQTPPPGQGDQRRPRTGSFELPEKERILKQRRRHALDTCQENQLNDDALEKFMEVSAKYLPLVTDLKYASLTFQRCSSLCMQSFWSLRK